MNIKPHHLWIGAGVLVVGGVVYGIARTANTANELQTRMRPKVKRWGFDRVELELDVELTNPTGGAMTIRDLSVSLHHQDPKRENPLVAVRVPGQITIPAKYSGLLSDQAVYGATIPVTVAYASILQLAPAVVKALVQGGPPAVIEVVAPMKVSSPTLVETDYTLVEPLTIGG